MTSTTERKNASEELGVEEVYTEIWHYTSAVGLSGILSSQQLWATNIFYLNDAEEFTGFFGRSLKRLLQAGIAGGIAELKTTAEGRAKLASMGGEEELLERVPGELANLFRDASIKFPAYVTSFCFTEINSEAQDGLLSQWRGYGPDGGYAIVFDTVLLKKLLVEEEAKFLYMKGLWGNADYYDLENSFIHAETKRWEKEIESIAKKMLMSPSDKNQEELFDPIFSLAIRHKHRGFKEEREIRIAMIPGNDELFDQSKKNGNPRLMKPISFAHREGVLTPYIPLFGKDLGGDAYTKLPIKRIIVGPHPSKRKRRDAVELLLKQMGIDADVVCSEIPFSTK